VQWAQKDYVKASNTGENDRFGSTVVLSSDGKTLAVGAPFEDSSTTGANSTSDEAAIDSGAVYLFSSSNTNVWSQQFYIKASNTGAGDRFGNALAISSDGKTIAIGADYESSSTTGINSTDDDAAFASGAAYIFTRSTLGVLTQKSYVKAKHTASGDVFGAAVGLSGDGNTFAVGAHSENSSTTGVNNTPIFSPASSAAGAVFVY
jgi:hypothetical protein